MVSGATRLLAEMRDANHKIYVDDFGTGYSSFSYIRKLPIDALKVEKSFVDNMTTDLTDAAVVEAIIEPAHHLGLRVVTEGVETVEK